MTAGARQAASVRVHWPCPVLLPIFDAEVTTTSASASSKARPATVPALFTEAYANTFISERVRAFWPSAHHLKRLQGCSDQK
ncbi:hypothetical protein AAHC03_09848 [Spirometra sp. Aus1]